MVAEGAIRAIRHGLNIYTRMDGIERLRRAIVGKVERTLGVPLSFGSIRSARCSSRMA